MVIWPLFGAAAPVLLAAALPLEQPANASEAAMPAAPMPTNVLVRTVLTPISGVGVPVEVGEGVDAPRPDECRARRPSSQDLFINNSYSWPIPAWTITRQAVRAPGARGSRFANAAAGSSCTPNAGSIATCRSGGSPQPPRLSHSPK